MLVAGSKQRILRRLQHLYHGGFVDRPRAQVEYYRPGSNRMVYGLAPQGADFLAGVGTFSNPSKVAVPTNNSIRRMFLEHTLLVSDITVHLDVHSKSNGINFRAQDEILTSLPEHTRRKRLPFQWSVSALYNGTKQPFGILPDQVFSIRPPHAAPVGPGLSLFLEADCGTMPVSRASMQRSSIFRKMLAYHESWKQGLQRQHFGFHRVCILFVTTSAERLENLVAANKYFGNGSGSRLFLFADRKTFVPNPLTAPIMNGASETVTLMDMLQ